MNYINQLNAFYELLDSNPVSQNAFCLYGHLMDICNKLFWKERFTIANSTLVIKTGINRRTLDRARNELIQKKYIEYKKGSGNQAGEYKIIPLYQDNLSAKSDTQNNLSVQNDTQNEFDGQKCTSSVSQTVTQIVTQTDHIHKTENNNIYFNLINNARELFNVSSFGGKTKALAWAREQAEWNQISRDEQLWFINKL